MSVERIGSPGLCETHLTAIRPRATVVPFAVMVPS
jgi:hypothetical protein